MKVRVDQLRCDITGLCVMECPDIFRFQEGSKKAEAIREEVPSHLAEAVARAASRCPNRAVIVEKE